MNTSDDVIAKLTEKVANRYYGKYRGLVIDNDDLEKLGRIKVQVPSVLGEDNSVWAMPCVPYGGAKDQGFFFIPDVNAGVWVEFEEGNLEYPIWVGTFWSKPGNATEVPEPTDSQSSPGCKVIKTKEGHTIELVDEGSIRIVHSQGAKVEFNSDGDIVIEANGENVTIEGANIKLGVDAAQTLLRFEDFESFWNVKFYTSFITHTHTGNLGGPTPIVPPPDFPLVTPNFKVKKVHVE